MLATTGNPSDWFMAWRPISYNQAQKFGVEMAIPDEAVGLQAIVDVAEVGLAFRLNDYCLRIDLDAFAILLGLHALRACEAERPGCGHSRSPSQWHHADQIGS